MIDMRVDEIRTDVPGRGTPGLRGLIAVLVVAPGVPCVGVISADPARDTDFATELHGYGIYGPRDYDAWLGKIACKRLATHLDRSVIDSANSLSTDLPREPTPSRAGNSCGQH